MRAGRTRSGRIAATLTGAGLLLALLCVSGDPLAGEAPVESSQQGTCKSGGVPKHPYGERPPEDFLRYATRPVVIGCATLASGRRFELVGYQLAHGRQSSLCIDQSEPATGFSGGCGSNLVRGGGAIDAGSSSRNGGRPIVVSGALSASVRRVAVRYELRRRLRRTAAVVVRVSDPALLRAIAVARPFGLYLAEVPRGARAVTAEAYGRR